MEKNHLNLLQIIYIKQEDYRKITVERKGETRFFTSQVCEHGQLLSPFGVILNVGNTSTLLFSRGDLFLLFFESKKVPSPFW